MLDFLGIVVIISTLVLAGRQGEYEIAKIITIILCGFMLLSLLAKIKY